VVVLVAGCGYSLLASNQRQPATSTTYQRQPPACGS